jgi:hypothetical protein
MFMGMFYLKNSHMITKFSENNDLSKIMSFEEYIRYQFFINEIYHHPFPFTEELIRDEEFYGELSHICSVDDTLKMLKNEPNIHKKSFSKYSTFGHLSIEVKNDPEAVKNIITKINSHGWRLIENTLATINIYPINEDEIGNIRYLDFQGKFENEIQNDDDFVFYTITPTIFLSKENYWGLCPRTGNKISNIGERLYFYSYSDDDNIKKHIIDSFDKNTMDYQYKKEYTLLQVDVGKTNPKTRLFVEPGEIDKIYTLENIPKQHIKPLKTYSLDENGVIVN